MWEQSGLDVGTTAGFLHENVLHFLDGEALEDAALLAHYFSDVGEPNFSRKPCLLSSKKYCSVETYLLFLL